MKRRRLDPRALPVQLSAILAGTVIFVTIALLCLSTSIISDVIRSKAESSTRRELELAVSNFHSLIDNVDDFSITFSLDSGIRSLLRTYPSFPSDAAQSYNVRNALTQDLIYLEGVSTAFTSVDVLFRDGQLAHVSKFTPKEATLALAQDAIAETRETCHPVWSAPQRLGSNTLQEMDVFTVYKSVYDLDQFVYLGTIVLYVSAQSFGRVLETAASDHTKFYLLQGEQVLASASPEETYRPFAEVMAARDADFSAVRIQNGQIVPCDGGSQILYRQPLGLEDWYVVCTMPTDYLHMEIRSLTAIILLVCLVALLLTCLAAAVLSHRIVRPVTRLLHSVEDIPVHDGVPHLSDGAVTRSHVTSQNLDLMTDKIRQHIEQLYLDQQHRNQLHLRVMQEQIKPHFLYNALETASSLISLDLTQEAGEYIHQLSTFYRLSLSAGKDIIPLSQELRLTEAYLCIQKTRYCEFFDYQMTVDSDLSAFSIPKLTLQPIVENAIYHGLKPKRGKGQICLTARLVDGAAQIVIFDNGVGMAPQQAAALLNGCSAPREDDSFGLSSVLDRLRIFSGGRARLELDSEPGAYTRITLILPGGTEHEDSCPHR